MDEYLEWQARPIPVEHPFNFKGFCKRDLYDLIDQDLQPPQDQIIFPITIDLDSFSNQLKAVGGADITFAGFGYRGLVAFNESPSTRCHRVSVDELVV